MIPYAKDETAGMGQDLRHYLSGHSADPDLFLPDDYEPLVLAGKMLQEAGITPQSHVMSSYNLIGYKGDTFEKAEKRLIQTVKAGFVPYAMLYRNESGETDEQWRKFQREWLRPEIVTKKFGEVWNHIDD